LQLLDASVEADLHAAVLFQKHRDATLQLLDDILVEFDL